MPLESVADVYEDRSPNFISREGVQRKIVVQCNVADRDPLGTVTEIEAAVATKVKLPQGYRVEYGGQFESEAEASRRLLVLGAVVIVAILLILATAFHSTRDALIIMLNLPLALVGGVAGVYLAGGVLSVASIIGFITLFEIATRNGIMLVAHIRHLRESEGVTDFGGCCDRCEIQAPMAMVILSGLFTSTALNMVVVPAVYFAAGRRRTKPA